VYEEAARVNNEAVNEAVEAGRELVERAMALSDQASRPAS
jgi:hypothetical protein